MFAPRSYVNAQNGGQRTYAKHNISTILSRNIYRMWPRVLGRWAQGLAIGAAMYQWCEFKSRRGKNTVRFNFQTYIYKNLFTSKKIASA